MFNVLITDGIANRISSCIYEACRNSYTKHKKREDIPAQTNFKNCNSSNFKAIADVNLMAYTTYLKNGVPQADLVRYIEDWVKFEKLAKQSRNEELNCKINMEDKITR